MNENLFTLPRCVLTKILPTYKVFYLKLHRSKNRNKTILIIEKEVPVV